MKRTSILLIAGFGMLTACDKKKDECGKEPKICTEVFAFVPVSFTDKEGAAVGVKDYSAVNQRTGDTLKSNVAMYSSFVPGTYVIADDSHLKQLSAEGDDIKVSGTYQATGQTKSAMVKVKGGKCACHVEKVSGPEKIAFD
ncbi:hypothetical protein [Pedobacter sp. JY14-1]|uniref:hypothetical protein n=1 Tax=Pedobacter sp. JY14-1 TaxID=3034151 RepID=UPI0023E1F0AD|nr:hypothetical protein [Pedobacter sp. JY14-1]